MSLSLEANIRFVEGIGKGPNRHEIQDDNRE